MKKHPILILLLVLGISVLSERGQLQAVQLDNTYFEAMDGDPIAQFQVAERYAEGIGVKRSYSEAIHWFRLAAMQGHPQAQYELGRIYELGLVHERDYRGASRWYRMAAIQGHVIAQHRMAVLYRDGLGFTPDPVGSYAWFEVAALSDSQNSSYVRERDAIGENLSETELKFAKDLGRRLLRAIQEREPNQVALQL